MFFLQETPQNETKSGCTTGPYPFVLFMSTLYKKQTLFQISDKQGNYLAVLFELEKEAQTQLDL